jgi:hypothetical protein
MGVSILKKKLGIEKQIDDFLDQVSESGLLFKSGVEAYLRGNLDAFEKKMESITETEHKGDALRRSLEEQLYLRTLITGTAIARLNTNWFTGEQMKAIEQLEGREFVHKWQMNEALAEQSPQWRFRENDRNHNGDLRNKLTHLYKAFRYEIDY